MKERIKHDYTNEIELKSLVIRERNKHLKTGSLDLNNTINELIKEYIVSKDSNLKNEILEKSQITQIDKNSHERFGEIVLLMIKRILTKPNYSGYSWQDEFYSTACYRVFKYIHNFDCTKKSERTGNSVSAFSYITQIIVMSILEVINRNHKHSEELEKYASLHNADYGITEESKNSSTYNENTIQEKEIIIENIENPLYENLREITSKESGDLKIYYPKDYSISFDEYSKIQEITRGKRCISLIRLKV